jgi:DNA-binding IclR family transcriptional regulator
VFFKFHAKGHRLGTKVFDLACNFSVRKSLVQLSENKMEEIVYELNETCLLTVFRETDMKRIVLYVVQSNNELIVRIDTERNAYQLATGHLLLAYLPEKKLEMIVNRFGLPKSAEWPEATTRKKLFSELKK